MDYLQFFVVILLVSKTLNLIEYEPVRSFCAWCDAKYEFEQWKDDNPYIYVGLSDKGKALLTKLIITYDWYVVLHPSLIDTDYRDHLMSLFDDIPPRPNKPNPPLTLSETPQSVGVLYLSSNRSCAIITPTYVKH